MAFRAQLAVRGWVLLEVAIGVRENPSPTDEDPVDAVAEVPFGFTTGDGELEHCEPVTDA